MVTAKVHNNLIELMDMFVEAGIGVRDTVNPAGLDIVIASRHLLIAHHGHSGTLAVLSAAEGFIDRLSHEVFFVVDFRHKVTPANIFVLIIAREKESVKKNGLYSILAKSYNA
jgi:hypothetical protein